MTDWKETSLWKQLETASGREADHRDVAPLDAAQRVRIVVLLALLTYSLVGLIRLVRPRAAGTVG